MPRTLHESVTPELREKLGPSREREAIETTNHTYIAPFLYDNVEVGDFYEIDPDKGIELKALDGYISVEEDRPIVSVTVIGSGCVTKGFNICEWWDEGEDITSMKDGIVKRQRIDELNGIHPSIGHQMMMYTFPGLTFRAITGGRCNDAFEAMRHNTFDYYGDYFFGLWENTATFRVGPPYPNRISIRAGALTPEDRGDRMRYPGDYAIRVIEVAVRK
jgi:hypothetical protein